MPLDHFAAIEGKTSRGSHDRGRGRAALHLVSAFATRERLVLGQKAVGEGRREQDTIPLLLEKLPASGSLAGVLVTINAIARDAKVAQAALAADYLLAAKTNQPGLTGEIEHFFADAPAQSLDADVEVEKRHGRVEERIVRASADIGWLDGDRRFPGEYHFPKIATLASVEARVHEKGVTRVQPRLLSPRVGIRPPRPCAAPPRWPSSTTSPSISCAPPTTSEAS